MLVFPRSKRRASTLPRPRCISTVHTWRRAFGRGIWK